MADHRALEEEAERLNPVQPLKNTTRRGRTTLINPSSEYVGGGATPSMGLSQIRGGRKHRTLSPPSEDGLSGGVVVGAGTKKGQTRKTARKAYEGVHPTHLGRALRDHLVEMKGSGFYEDFKKGMMEGMSGGGMGNVSGPGFEAVSGGMRTGAYEGKGKMIIQHLPEGKGEEIMIGGRKMKKTRRPAGPNDGRKKRAEVVRRVMREKGLSMIEASRYVKQNGLY